MDITWHFTFEINFWSIYKKNLQWLHSVQTTGSISAGPAYQIYSILVMYRARNVVLHSSLLFIYGNNKFKYLDLEISNKVCRLSKWAVLFHGETEKYCIERERERERVTACRLGYHDSSNKPLLAQQYGQYAPVAHWAVSPKHYVENENFKILNFKQ